MATDPCFRRGLVGSFTGKGRGYASNPAITRAGRDPGATTSVPWALRDFPLCHRTVDLCYPRTPGSLRCMDEAKKSLEDLLRDELGDEPSQEAKDYARRLYERYRLPLDETTPNDSTDTVTGRTGSPGTEE